MKHFIFILTFIILSRFSCLAHQDFIQVQVFGKVKVRIQTGYYYEELKKAWIIGELANRLVNKLEYSDTIFLDFHHYYVADCVPDYFISYGDGKIINDFPGGNTAIYQKSKSLLIREVSRKFEPEETLKLIEHAILNKTKIIKDQRWLKYHKNYKQWILQTIDTSNFRKIVNTSTSVFVQDVLFSRVYRQRDSKDTNQISYYFEGNKYNVWYGATEYLSIKNVYQFKALSSGEAVVFDTDSTFYVFHIFDHPAVSKRLSIVNKGDFYQPYHITKVGEYKFAISLHGWLPPSQRSLVFDKFRQELVQDLDEKLWK